MNQKTQPSSDADEQKKPSDSPSDLPEREELTPELVEDEAIRGDFMLRWALVLLTFLMACTLITDTRTLVHIKSGLYTIENGMPARTGIFSASAEDRPWRNLSWLFDVILAATYSMPRVGAIGLSVLKALIAAAAFAVIVHTNRKDVSSWWGTICATLALLVCYPQMTAMPEVATFLGLALTLYWLNRWSMDDERKYLIRLVILFAVWSNLDPRMYLGLAVIGLYAAGEWLGNWLGFSGGLQSDSRRKVLWITFGCCLLATMLNPFGWHALLSPVALYGQEYPAYRELHPLVARLEVLQYYPMTHASFLELINHNMISGLVVILAALVTFGLNHRRLDFGHLFVGLGFLALAVVTTRDLAAAAVVCAVLATLNAQQWYQHTFRQTYSVQTSELLFSRGGRAATVLVLFGLAYLAISGQMDWFGSQGHMVQRAGFGFDYNLQQSIDGLLEDTRDSLDDRPFNFSERQGDILVWIGKKPFIDSRLALYSGGGNDDLIGRFKQTRNDLRKGKKVGDEDEGGGWKSTLDEFDITHVTPRLDSRLSTSQPDYITHMALLDSGDWQMTRFGPTSSVFYRTDIRNQNPKLDAYLKEKQERFIASAFRINEAGKVAREEYARKPTLTEKYLSRPKPKLPNGVLLARHYNRMFEYISGELSASEREGRQPALPQNILQGAQPTEFRVALLYLQVRSANRGLLDDPQNAEAFKLLGAAYSRLREFEVAMIRRQPDPGELQETEDRMRTQSLRSSRFKIATMRFRQAVCAYRQSLEIEPDNVVVLRALAALYEQQGMFDAAVDMLRRSVEIANNNPIDANVSEISREVEERFRKADQEKLDLLTKRIQPVLDKIEVALPKMGPEMEGLQLRAQAIEQATAAGCLKRAVELQEEQLESFSAIPQFAIRYVQSLLLLGRIEDAATHYTDINSKNENLPRNLEWRLLGAAIAVCTSDYSRATTIFERSAQELDGKGIDELTYSIPFVAGSVNRLPYVIQQVQQGNNLEPRIEPWAKFQALKVEQAMHIFPADTADQMLKAAICQLESGRALDSGKTLQDAIEYAPGSATRPLAGFYLKMTTGKEIPAVAPAVGNSAKSKSDKTPSKTHKPAGAKIPRSARPNAA